MSKTEILNKIKMIIENGNYDIEELLAIIPEDLIEDVKDIIKSQTKEESEEIKLDLNERTR